MRKLVATLPLAIVLSMLLLMMLQSGFVLAVPASAADQQAGGREPASTKSLVESAIAEEAMRDI